MVTTGRVSNIGEHGSLMYPTLFTLEWLRDPELRPRVLAGLNKGESLHSLKRAVAFHRSGDIRTRSLKAQSNRASGLNLVVMSISIWKPTWDGSWRKTVPDELLAHISPPCWEHISLTGDYHWREDLVPLSGTDRDLGR